MHTRQQGFTLLDSMIALAIAAVLCAVALPSFEGQLRKARRTDALVTMAQIQLAQERLYSRAARYGSLAEIGMGPASRSGHYTLQIASADADGYTALAVATGVQGRDEACRYLSVRAAGADLSFASGQDASVANAPAANRQCWSL